jgi:hypothetical protein
VQAANLFTITSYEGLDPELQSQPNSSGQIINTYEFGIDQGLILIRHHSYLELTSISKSLYFNLYEKDKT